MIILQIFNIKFSKNVFLFIKVILYEVLEQIGHPVGGVCPFGIKPGVKVYLDESLRRFDVVYPAAGTASSAVKLTIPELYTCSQAQGWVDVTKLPEA